MSKIEWTDRTWNPVTGCNKVSQGCKNCYAEVMHRRLMKIAPHKYQVPFLKGIQLHEDVLRAPFKGRDPANGIAAGWQKPHRVFVNSMSDLFHEQVPFLFIDSVFATMAILPHITFQVLTKRPERMLEWSKQYDGPVFPLPNVWLGVSCEDQAVADERIPILLKVPATVRFLSCEPLLGPLTINPSHYRAVTKEYQSIDWVIVGGESGHNARPMNPNWARSIRDQCHRLSIPFFFKQWGEWFPFELADGAPSVPDTPRAITRDGVRFVRGYGKQRRLDKKYWNQFPKV